ncbi:MAG: hypothetical protein OEW02_06240, partial [Myxococcales bacterium]|nr:hypothetical protein [Myxococcales bacterium]
MAGCSFARRPSNAFRRAPARPPRWARRGGPLAWAPALAGALGLGFLAAAPIALARPLGATECSDAIDNDADGFIDLADAGCLADLLRDDETGELVVNSTLDAIDANPGDGLCQTQLMGECTVRAAIMEANASPGKQGVQVPTGTFELTIAPVGASPGSADGDLDIAGDLVLIGAGAENTRIGGTSELSLFSDRIFEILPATQVTISGVTAQYAGAYDGGGIFNAGTLALMNTRVSGNRAYDTGGGIYDVGTLTITNSTISWNYTPYNGGGIFIQSGGTLTLVDSAVSGNSNSYYADGGAGIFSEGTATLTNSTVSGNYALASGGGGIDNRGIMALTNSTVSGNYAKYGGGGIVNTSTLSLMNSSVSGNEAYYVSGDGIFNWGSGQTQLISSLIAANGDENCGCFFGGSPMPCDSFIDSNGHNLS